MRLSAQRKQLDAMVAAQAERETALHEAEKAHKQAAEAQRKRARIRNIAFVVVSIFAVLAGWLYSDAERQRKQADDLLASATNLIGELQPNDDMKKRIFAVFQNGADHGDKASMVYLGFAYLKGWGVAQDYAKGRQWNEKAAAYDANAMFNLGQVHVNGWGVAKDPAKARHWYEKAANRGHPLAMFMLATLYADGEGGPQDYAKAVRWYEKAADMGMLDAKQMLELLLITQAARAGRYGEALQRQEAYAAMVEAEETKHEGKAGERTARALDFVAWFALFAREYTRALTVAERAHALLPDDLTIERKRAHALMFLGGERAEESKTLYPAHKGKPESDQDGKTWKRAITQEFEEFRKAGLTHPMMAFIERELEF